ncbi:MAG: sulfite exporter TauE/SafE family protein [Ruminococcaceae bacterium]|nr:sulfite exporter TauE/SafE family protein [Oscillospiraceae bacterium]
MLALVYSVVILIATTLGAFVGLGGGVIIKPILDFIGAEPRMQVDFLSSMAVFTMSVVSTGKSIKNKVKFKKDIIAFISAGSVAGGFLGSYCMDLLGNFFAQENIRCIQAFVLATLLTAVCIYVSKQSFSFHVKNPFAICFVGLTLGFFASFLGIGGGPINVAVLTLFFSMNVKESAVYSVAIIFFSQLSKLATIFVSTGIEPYIHQWKTLIFILPAAILGGIIGSKFNRKFDDVIIRKIFVAVMILLVILNVYNGIVYLTL